MNASQRMDKYWKEELKRVHLKECYKGSVCLFNTTISNEPIILICIFSIISRTSEFFEKLVVNNGMLRHSLETLEGE